MLKSMTGQDPLRLERKNQQQQGSFIYEGQTLMMSNERLATTDYTSGIERRRITVEFKKRISRDEKENWAQRGGEANILNCEAPGIINWALQLSAGEVTALFKEMPEKIRLSNLDAARFNNPLVDWMLQSLLPCPHSFTQIGNKGEYRLEGRVLYDHAEERLYPNYLTWCQGSGREKVSLQRFAASLIDAAATFGAEVSKRRDKGGTKIYGLRIRKLHEEEWLTLVKSPEKNRQQVKGLVKANQLKMFEMQEVKGEEKLAQSSSGMHCSTVPVHQQSFQHVEVEV